LASISAYLDDCRSHLATDPNCDQILSDLESHIHEAIAVRNKEGDPAGTGVVDMVLAELDPPHTYASADSASSSRLYWPSVLSLALLPWGLPVLWHVITLTPIGDHWEGSPFYEGTLYQVILMPLGIVTAITASVLGKRSAKTIRESSGLLSGHDLALCSAVLYPIAIILLIAIIVASNLLDHPSDAGSPYAWLSAFSLAFIIVLSYCLRILKSPASSDSH
jgi:hypothetical protein